LAYNWARETRHGCRNLENHSGHRWLRRIRRRCQNDCDIGGGDDANDRFQDDDNDDDDDKNNIEVVISDFEVYGCE